MSFRNWGQPLCFLEHGCHFVDAKSRRKVTSLEWVKLLRFPLPFWAGDIFSEIGNAIGSFLEDYFSFKECDDMFVSKFLVGTDMRVRLSKEILLEKCVHYFVQKFDYYGLTFMCLRFHRYGHVIEEYSLSFKKLKMVKKEWMVDEGGRTMGCSELFGVTCPNLLEN